jgi:hypothetical protein
MAEGFLRSWIATNVEPTLPSERADRVAKWAATCAADAIMGGIPYDELKKAAGGNLLHCIQNAADTAARWDRSHALRAQRPEA